MVNPGFSNQTTGLCNCFAIRDNAHYLENPKAHKKWASDEKGLQHGFCTKLLDIDVFVFICQVIIGSQLLVCIDKKMY